MFEELKESIFNLVKENKRLDNRSLEEYRQPLRVIPNISGTAEGSALVSIGETKVVAGVKLAVDRPYPDAPDEGGLMVNVELLPLSHPEYMPGPPGIKATEIARVIDRGLREGKAIDLKKLVLEAGEKAWFVQIDLCSLNDDGNLIEAMGLAALAAFKNTFFPKYDEKNVDYKEKTKKKLPLLKSPLPIVVSKINNSLVMDLNRNEEAVRDSWLSVSLTEDNLICALQKGRGALKWEDLPSIFDLAIKKAAYLRSFLE